MSISCPSCDKSELSATTLEDYLPARICLQCRGTLLSLIAYRDWRNMHAPPARAANNVGEACNVADSTKLLRCPHCAALMTKFRFSADAKNQIDLCDRCDSVWLDHGEWVLVEHLALSGQLAKVFDANWQKRLREEQARRRAEERWRLQLGEDYEKVRELRTWLALHPKGKELVAYLYLSQTEGF
ncbi:MAG: zf-TFIIB domain-containing protein [Pseudomonadota bacterium]|nr:zf-TFIIB domain-containing protein [Pseudomonadota bacterium]